MNNKIYKITSNGETYDVQDKELTDRVEKIATFQYADYSLPTIYLEGDASAMNASKNEVEFSYIYGERAGTCTLKWQGSSSIAFPKKNYTVKFDNAFEAVSGWGEEKKYVLKADWVDFSHCRNVVSAKLWGDVVRSRATSDLVTRLSALPNCGAIDGFPCFVVINGEWMGVYNFTIPKDNWMMGMGSGEKEAILCCEGVGDTLSNACSFNAEATLGVEFENEYSSDGWAESDIQTSLNTLIRAVMNSDGTDIDTTIAQYLDIDSAIDYLLFAQLLAHHDGINKNYILATYDGVKWFFSAYDMDNVYGQEYPGSKFYPATLNVDRINANRLFNLLYTHKSDELLRRLNEMLTKRHAIIGVGTSDAGVMSVANVDYKFTNYASQIPLTAYIADAEKWTGVPSTSANNFEQAVAWYTERSKYLLSVYEGRKPNENAAGTKGLTYTYSDCSSVGSCCEPDITLGVDVIAPDGVTIAHPFNVGGQSFARNTFVETITIPEQYTMIKYGAFRECPNLRKVSIPESVTQFDSATFVSCTSLRCVSLPKLTRTGTGIFNGCTSLERVKLAGVPEITEKFFYNCSALKDIFYGGTIAEWDALTKGADWNTNTGDYTVHCTDGDIAKA